MPTERSKLEITRSSIFKCSDCPKPSEVICGICGLYYCAVHIRHISKEFIDEATKNGIFERE